MEKLTLIVAIVIFVIVMGGLILLGLSFLGDEIPRLENNTIVDDSLDEVLEETPIVEETPQDEDHPRTAYDEQKTKDLMELCNNNLDGTYDPSDNKCTKANGEVVDMEGWDYP